MNNAMPDVQTAVSPEAVDASLSAVPAVAVALPRLSELDNTRLALLKEKRLRLAGDATNLQMLQRQLEARLAELNAETQAFSSFLRASYALENGDEIADDGAIQRAPKQVKE